MSVQIIASFIPNLTNMLSQIYNLFVSINSNNNATHIQKIIKDTDIEATIQTIDFYMKSFDETVLYNNNAIKHCVEKLNEVINSIVNELNRINDKIQYNNTLYFGYVLSTFRVYNFKTSKKRLISHIDILHKRWKMFLDIMNINNNWPVTKVSRICYDSM